jgi:hypothetical protein
VAAKLRLDEILHEHKLTTVSQPMNYVNYEGKIVERFGVALGGWPTKHQVCNLNKLGGWQEVSELLTALQSKDVSGFALLMRSSKRAS